MIGGELPEEGKFLAEHRGGHQHLGDASKDIPFEHDRQSFIGRHLHIHHTGASQGIHEAVVHCDGGASGGAEHLTVEQQGRRPVFQRVGIPQVLVTDGEIGQELVHDGLQFILPLLPDLSHLIRSLGDRHGEDLDAESLHQLVLVHHHAGERKRAVAQLHDTHMLPVLQHTGHCQKIGEILREHVRVHSAGGDLSEGHVVALQQFGQGEEAALAVQQTLTVLGVADVPLYSLHTEVLFLRRPDQGRKVQQLSQLSSYLFTSEVDVGDEQRVDLLRTEKFRDPLCLGVVIHHSVVCDPFQVHELHMLIPKMLLDVGHTDIHHVICRTGAPDPLAVAASEPGHIPAAWRDADLDLVTYH